MAVKLRKSPLFKETYKFRVQDFPILGSKLNEFIRTKQANPHALYGSTDGPMNGIMSKEVPKLSHAHLTQNLSIFYTINGSDPTQLRLYGIFSHSDVGTGSNNRKKSAAVAKRMAQQVFD